MSVASYFQSAALYQLSSQLVRVTQLDGISGVLGNMNTSDYMLSVFHTHGLQPERPIICIINLTVAACGNAKTDFDYNESQSISAIRTETMFKIALGAVMKTVT